MNDVHDVYLDIETVYQGDRGVPELFDDHGNHEVVMVGVLHAVDGELEVVDGEVGLEVLVKDGTGGDAPVSAWNLEYHLEGVDRVITYNGRTFRGGGYNSRGFDGPVLKEVLGVDLGEYEEIDLMLVCHEHGLYGGMKSVEGKLGILRALDNRDGGWASETYLKWRETGLEPYLDLVRAYNREDVINLWRLKVLLDGKR